ncbi:bluetail domain-containing putative surface protein [Thalassospira sp. TSL5-1]|uniref:bluetail domain-containing putative surface protein n=1 Tax=Thalassospira sp. TSL5-1 TaxID=1544451 RepID=UPI000938EA2F|nr:bluetail domain-containing putative surface protein [Thalassospira sp. TSL5-1]
MTSNMNSVDASAQAVVGELVAAIDRDTNAAFLAGHFLPSIRVAHQDVDFDVFAGQQTREIEIPRGRKAFLEFIADWQKKYQANLKLGIVSTLILPLAACGGGGGGLGSAFGGGSGGRVVDGYISGATVSRVNGSGNTVTTDANGNFTGLTGSGAIQITGGTDISTGLAFNGKLTAPDGSTVVTPLTTLVQSLIDSGETETDALNAVKAAFNVTEDLKTVDPVATNNTELFKAGVQVANILTMGAKAITGASGGQSEADAIKSVADALAATLKGVNTTVTLDSSAINNVLQNAGVDTTLSGDTASIISASNTNIQNAATTDDIVKSQYIAQGEAANAIQEGAASGSLSQTAAEYDADAQAAKAQNVALSNGGVGSFTVSVTEQGALSFTNLPTSGNITLTLDAEGGGSVVYNGGTLTIPDTNTVTSLDLSGVGRPVIINDFGAVTTLTGASDARTTIVGSFQTLRDFIPTSDGDSAVTGLFTFRITGISDLDESTNSDFYTLVSDIKAAESTAQIAVVGAENIDFTITATNLAEFYSLAATGTGTISLTGATTGNLAASVAKLATGTGGTISAEVSSGDTLALSKTLLGRLSALDFNVDDGTINYSGATSSALTDDLAKIDTTGHSVVINVTGAMNESFSVTDDQLANLGHLTAQGTGTITITSLDNADDISAIQAKLTVATGSTISLVAAADENIAITKAQLDQIATLTVSGTGEIALSGATSADLENDFGQLSAGSEKISITGASGENFSLTKSFIDQLAHFTTTGSGNLNVTDLTAADLTTDLAKLTVDGTTSLTGAAGEDFVFDKTFLDNYAAFAATGDGTITYQGAVAADLQKLSVVDGTISVSGAENESFSLSEAQLTDYAAFEATGSGTVTLTGVTATGVSAAIGKVTVGSGIFAVHAASGENIVLSQAEFAQIDSISTTGSGNLTLNGYSASSLSDVITKTSVDGTLTVNGAAGTSFVITQNDLDDVDVLNATGTGDVTLSGVTGLRLAAALSAISVETGSFAITGASGESFTIAESDLAELASLEATGDGNIVLNGATASGLEADLAKLSVTETGELTVNGADGENLSVTKAQLDDLAAINVADGGTLTITGLTGADFAADLAKVSANGGLILSGAEGENFLISKTVLAGINQFTVTGSGGVTLTDVTAASLTNDVAKITVDTGKISIIAADGESLTLTQAEAASYGSVEVTGTGNITVTGVSGDVSAVLDNLTVASGSISISAAADQNLSITETDLGKLGGLAATGTGNITLSDASSANVASDLAKLSSETGTISITVSESDTSAVNLTYEDIAGKNVAINATGDVNVTVAESGDYDFSTLSGTTVKLVFDTTNGDLTIGELDLNGIDEIEVNGAGNVIIQAEDVDGLTINFSANGSGNVIVAIPEGTTIDQSGLSGDVEYQSSVTYNESGVALDGYLANATVMLVDGNGNQVGQQTWTTDENGHYSISNFQFTGILPEDVAVRITGGTDLTTGQSFDGELLVSAGQNATVATGLTAVMHHLVASDAAADSAAAQSDVIAGFGLDATALSGTNLLTTDPVATITSDSATAAEKANAASLQIAATEVLVVTSELAKALQPVLHNGGDESSLGEISQVIMRQIAAAIENGTEVDWTNGTVLTDLITATGNAIVGSENFDGSQTVGSNNIPLSTVFAEIAELVGNTISALDQLQPTSSELQNPTDIDALSLLISAIKIQSAAGSTLADLINDLFDGNGNFQDAAYDALVAYNDNFATNLEAALSDVAIGELIDGTIMGSSGADILDNGDAGGAFFGYGGNDTITGGTGNDTLMGGEGNDSLAGDSGNDVLLGEEGNDTLTGGAGVDTLMGGAGDDRFFIDGDGDTLIGGDGKDRFYLTSAADLANGLTLSGDGTSVGNTGQDRLIVQLADSGGAQAVDLTASNVQIAGIDRIDVGSDVAGLTITLDHALASTADNNQDDILGDIRVNSRVYVDNESEIGVTASAISNDIIVDGRGLEATDSLFFDGEVHVGQNDANTGLETYGGFSGNDTVYGGAGNDTLFGGAGNDRLYGEDGNDYLDGGDGDDRLYAGNGINTLIGGAGADRFYITNVTDAVGSVIDGNGGSSTEGAKVSNDRLILDLAEGGNVDFNNVTVSNIDRIDIAQDAAGLELVLDHDLASTADANGDGNTGDIRITSRVYVDNESQIGLTSSPITNGIFVDGTALEGTDSLQFDGDVHVGQNDADTGLETYGGFSGDDTILGGAGGDFIAAGDGDDRMNGNDGDDVLFGGNGSDRIHGGAGVDTLIGGAGTDRLYIDQASDLTDGSIIVGGDYDVDNDVLGTAEADTNDRLIFAQASAYDLSDSNLGNHNIQIAQIDRIEFRDNASGYELVLGDGVVSTADANGDGILGDIQIVSRASVVDGETETDVPMTAGVTVDARNLSASQSIHFQGEILIDDETSLAYGGFSGDDRIRGGLGNDTINGGAGDDRIYYNGGSDTLIGGTGRDRFYITTAALAAGLMIDGTLEAATNDRLLLSAAGSYDLSDQALSDGNVTITHIDRIELRDDAPGNVLKIGAGLASSADANMDGTVGDISVVSRVYDNNDVDVPFTNDVVIDGSELTSEQSLIVEGEVRNDPVDGDYGGFNGNDTMMGGAGNDTLEGGNGDDTLIGNGGDDYLTGGSGADVMSGGAGNDIFAMSLGGDAVTVEYPDYTPAQGDYFEVVIDGYAYGARADESETSIDSVLSDIASVINSDSGHNYHARVQDGVLQIAGVDANVTVDAKTYAQGDAYSQQPTSEDLFAFSFTDTTMPEPGDFLRLTVGDEVFQVQMSDGDTPGSLLFQLATQISARAEAAYTLDENADVVDAVALDTDGDSENLPDRLFLHIPQGETVDFDHSGTIRATSGSVFIETDAGDSFNVDVAADSGTAQTGTLTLSTDDADYVAGSFLSAVLTITASGGGTETTYVSTAVTAGNAAKSIQDFIDEIKAQDAASARADGDVNATFFDSITVNGGAIEFVGKEVGSSFSFDATFLGDLGPNSSYIDPAQGENDTFDAVIFDFEDFGNSVSSLTDHGTFVLAIDDFTLTQPVQENDTLSDIISRFADSLRSYGYTVGVEDDTNLFVASDEAINGHSIAAYQAGSESDNGVEDTASVASDSIASMTDVITDFVIGEDKFDLFALGGGHIVPTGVSVGDSVSVTTFDESMFSGLEIGNGAAMFVQATDSVEDRTYLVVDNGDGAVNMSEDLFINVTGITGDINTASVSDLFYSET